VQKNQVESKHAKRAHFVQANFQLVGFGYQLKIAKRTCVRVSYKAIDYTSKYFVVSMDYM